MKEIMRLLKEFIPSVKAYFNREPGREVPEDFDTRLAVLKHTSDRDIIILKDFLTLNKYSRPGKLRTGVKAIEVHWVGNKGTSAKMNRNYFELRRGGKHGFGSTQFIIDLDGDIIQMIPEKEIAFSSGAKRYKDGIQFKLGKIPYYNTLSIECTHINWNGSMTKKTQDGLMKLCSHLCRKYGLTAKDLLLHYDITGKDCHRFFVNNPDKWGAFRDLIDVEVYD